jgi:hypothetical protein
MGKLEDCRVCGRPVLELDGQFEVLQPYYAEPGDPALEIAGWLHTPCLAGSEYRQRWVRWRIKHFTEGRGYEISSDVGDWTVLRDRKRRSVLAFHKDGASVASTRSDARVTPCEGGGCIGVERDAHITIEDPEFIASIQQELTTQKQVAIAKVVDQLQIRDRLQWTGVLEAGKYMFSRTLRGDWNRRSFSARAHYQLFLPSVVLATWQIL